MKLTLRRANALQTVITEQLAATPVVASITIGKHDNPEELLANSIKKLEDSVNFKLLLTTIYYNLRKKVAKSSQEAGIADLLADLAEADKAETLQKSLINNQKATPSMDVIKAHLEDLKQPQTTAAYNRPTGFEVSLITQESANTIVKNLSEIRKKKQKISDKLLHLNVSTEIELSETDEEILTKLDLL